MIKIPKFGILLKLSVVFIITVLLTIGSATALWFSMIQPILQKNIILQQSQLGKRASEKTEEFLKAKLRALIIHSQSATFLTGNTELEKLELGIFLAQDQDIQTLTVINKEGRETIKIDRNSLLPIVDLLDRSNSPSFLANTFRYTKEFIGEAEFSENGEPSIVLSVPMKTPSGSGRLTQLSTQVQALLPGEGNEVFGVLEAKVSLKDLFAEITDLGLEDGTVILITDRKGRIIAHKDKALVNPTVVIDKYPPIKQHVETVNESPLAHTEEMVIFDYLNENNVKVIGSHTHVRETSWAIVVQQSAANYYADLNRVLNFATLLLLGGIGISIPFSFWLSKRITQPLRALTHGVNKISEGNFDYRINIHTHDELDEMAKAFNQMTEKLKDSIEKLKSDKDVIASEKGKLEIVLSGIDDAIVALDHETKIIFINTPAEKLTGYQNNKITGQKINTLLKIYNHNLEIPVATYCALNSTKMEGVIFEKKAVKIHSKGGKERYINIITGKIKSNQNNKVEYILTIHDITKNYELEEMKLDFVSMAAHELRTPLTSIIGYTQILLEETKSKLTKKYFDILEKTYHNAKKLSGLVDNLLSVSRIEKGTLKLQLMPLDLISLAAESIDDMENLLSSKRQTMIFNPLKSQEAWILGDKFRISEVFVNLIGNAINYTPEKGSIEISIKERANKYLVQIKDNGPGIPQEAIPKLFTKFYRASGGLEQSSKGTGLGLYICKSIISLHKGRIWVESESGKGTIVFFELSKLNNEGRKKYIKNISLPHTGAIIRNDNLLQS